MLDSYQNPTGMAYTGTLVLLILALVVIPAVLILSRPLGYESVSLGTICSALCVGFALTQMEKAFATDHSLFRDPEAAAKMRVLCL